MLAQRRDHARPVFPRHFHQHREARLYQVFLLEVRQPVWGDIHDEPHTDGLQPVRDDSSRQPNDDEIKDIDAHHPA